MRTLRFYMFLVSAVFVLSVQAQEMAKQPQAVMQSTSVLAGTGSTLPQAAVTGTLVTGTTIGTYTSSHPGRVRRDVGGGGTTEDDPDPHVPYEPNPLGDGLWPLMAMAFAFCAYLALRSRKRKQA